MMKKYLLTILTALTLALAGCTDAEVIENNNAGGDVAETSQEQQNHTATIKLTKDEEEVVSEDTVEFEEGENLMEVMERNYDITTGFGGAFIMGIDGIEADEEEGYYWLINVNDEMLMVGANEYILEQNDVVHFNYAKTE